MSAWPCTEEEVERLLARCEPKGECLVWTGATQKGYGAIKVGGRKGTLLRVHRLFCEWAHGPAPEGKPGALHRCNTKACVHADHLYWGNQRENAQDCAVDGTPIGRPWKVRAA